MTISRSSLFSPFSRAACLAAFAAACALPVQAASTAASSASSAGSASSGSVSDSIGASSNSSGGDNRVAAGQYRVIDIAAAPGKPDTTRITLQAAAAGAMPTFGGFTLDVPNRALAQRGVDKGALVQVNAREYGYEFAHADSKQAFFLALEDNWYRELGSRKVAI
jgi:hypothetical protein